MAAADAKIIDALSGLNVPFFKWFDEYDGETFPVIAYHLISQTPDNFGDDREISCNYIYQLSIISNTDDEDELAQKIRDAMFAQGFSFISLDELRDEKDNFIIALRFYISI